jgi:phosphoserine phosphatase
MDGTLLEEDSSWVALHRHFGTTEAGKDSLKLYTEGKIDYVEFMRRDIAAWPRGTTKEEIESVLSKYRIRGEAPRAIGELRRRGVEIAMVTSGIDILASRVARELGIEHWVANSLEFDRKGRLTGRGIGRVDPVRKDVAYLGLLSRLGLDSGQTIAVGDTVYDLSFLKSAGMGFMLAHTTRVRDPQIIHIRRLTDVLSYI